MTDASPEIMIAQEVIKIHTELKVDDRVSIKTAGEYENGTVIAMRDSYVFVLFRDAGGQPTFKSYMEIDGMCYQCVTVALSLERFETRLTPVRIFRT